MLPADGGNHRRSRCTRLQHKVINLLSEERTGVSCELVDHEADMYVPHMFRESQKLLWSRQEMEDFLKPPNSRHITVYLTKPFLFLMLKIKNLLTFSKLFIKLYFYY